MVKTAVITGGSRGIGRAVVYSLARDGFIPVINYVKSREAAESIAKETGGIAIQADVSDYAHTEKMIETAVKQTGRIDVLVNNAGISVTGLFTDITPKQASDMWNVNVQGTFNCTKAVLPFMINKKRGKIINISSMWGQTGASCEVHYSASKAAVIGFTKALAKEVGPSGINVNCIAPGVIETDMNLCHSPETMAELAEETPLGRIGKPEDIAEAVSFLASDKSDFITGQIIGVNGGFII
ncbi:elongation factor P 5-aminopentanone reductase [Porcipelethomonas sp.]|uniref:elongation factor P 5-aminopentanone reductase n=1 Tax=Porcipelethomonas sp. TaxID=2981675 RepID=UPI003EF815B7